jgi:hypothetical protein
MGMSIRAVTINERKCDASLMNSSVAHAGSRIENRRWMMEAAGSRISILYPPSSILDR